MGRWFLSTYLAVSLTYVIFYVPSYAYTIVKACLRGTTDVLTNASRLGRRGKKEFQSFALSLPLVICSLGNYAHEETSWKPRVEQFGIPTSIIQAEW
ncbi:hypothetical protein F5Y05DRAFT_319106 [Hypoxylon sp. FL0543]|nr:hypothetical protein F5Y05DRAFT_319106 [Hypoxylon sp. FL0543]